MLVAVSFGALALKLLHTDAAYSKPEKNADMKTKSVITIGLATLIVATVCTIMLRHPTQPDAPQRINDPNLFPFVRSLQGTNPPDVTVDNNDELVANAELRHMFDYYLSAGSEATPQAIRTKIEEEIDRTLKPHAAMEAKRLLTQYLNYRAAVMALQKNQPEASPGESPIRARLLAIQQIRTLFFTPKEISGMFGFDDEYAEDAIARMEINQDKNLTPEQKKAKLAKLDASMSPALREAREAPFKVAKMEETAAKMRADGATDDDVYRMRAKAFSPEAASRLADLDKQTADWQRRITSYQADRNNVLANNTLSDADKQAAIQQLRDAQFNSTEQLRLGAYE